MARSKRRTKTHRFHAPFDLECPGCGRVATVNDGHCSSCHADVAALLRRGTRPARASRASSRPLAVSASDVFRP